jgi:hypothetical protein
MVRFLPRKLSSSLRLIKDDLALKTPVVYGIAYKYGNIYVGQTGHLIETRIKEHYRHIHLFHPKKSAVAQHSTASTWAIASSYITPVSWPRS